MIFREQFGATFILAKTYLINPSSIPGMRFILYGYNVDKFEFIQEFDGSTTGMPHHFKISFQDFLAVPNFLTGGLLNFFIIWKEIIYYF